MHRQNKKQNRQNKTRITGQMNQGGVWGGD